MKIAQVAPLQESIPPQYYGGAERVVSYLTEELARQGHQVTLFASGDSVTQARLVPICRQSLRLSGGGAGHLAQHVLLLERVLQHAHKFDVIHYHVPYLHFPFARRAETPQVTTLHGPLDIPDLLPLFEEFQDVALVSVSQAQRQPVPWANWRGTVYHGLPADLYHFHPEPGKYLVFLGRISPEKQPDQAIRIAERSGVPLKIAARVDPVDQPYFDQVVRPLLDHPLVEYLGEIGEHEKDDLLGNALALLFPINWPEPFGLVQIEALACGTPVIAYRRGSVPEVIEDGVTGYIVDDENGAVRAVQAVSRLRRHQCRRSFKERFTAARMARDYLQVYQQLIDAIPSTLLPGRAGRRADRVRPISAEIRPGQIGAPGFGS